MRKLLNIPQGTFGTQLSVLCACLYKRHRRRLLNKILKKLKINAHTQVQDDRRYSTHLTSRASDPVPAREKAINLRVSVTKTTAGQI